MGETSTTVRASSISHPRNISPALSVQMQWHSSGIFSLNVKDSGMRVEEAEKKGGKEDGSPTMPLMLFSFYRVIRSWRKGRDFFARLEYKQDGIPSCRGCGAQRCCVLRSLL